MDDVDQQFELHPSTMNRNTNAVAPNAGTTTTSSSDVGRDVGASVSADRGSSGVPIPVSKPAASGPVPMSMPSALRNPGMSTQSNHLAYLLDRHTASSSSYTPSPPRAQPRSGSSSSKELGRRKQRRSDNARLLSNPHAVRPSLKDYRLHSNEIRSTFHPSHSTSAGSAARLNQHNLPVPSSSGVRYSAPVHDPVNSREGHFGTSLKDAQHVLKLLDVSKIGDEMIRERRAGDLERFIWLVEREIRRWSGDDVHVFANGGNKDAQRKMGRVLLNEWFNFTTRPLAHVSEEQQNGQGVARKEEEKEEEAPMVSLDTVRPGKDGQLIEFQRTPNALVWLVHDPFLRLIVHCLARVSHCPSFSKDDASRPGLRFTWILNRNPLARRARRGRRVSISSSAMSVSATQAALTAEPGPRPQRRAPYVQAPGGVLETPPTTDLDSHTEADTESEIGVQTETETESDMDQSSMGGSMVIVQPIRSGGGAAGGGEDADEGEQAGAEDVLDDEVEDTDEDEAEILRRVRRWAIDSHRQRASHAKDNGEDDGNDDAYHALSTSTSASRRSGKARIRSTTGAGNKIETEDPDQTLTGAVIAEEEDEEDNVHSFSDA